MAIRKFSTSTIKSGTKSSKFWDQTTVPLPAIVTSGLEIFWDIANPSSYSGSGSSIYNIAPNSLTRTATISNGGGYTASGLGSYLTLSSTSITNSNYSAPSFAVGSYFFSAYVTGTSGYWVSTGASTTGQSRSFRIINNLWGFVSYGGASEDQNTGTPDVTYNGWQIIALTYTGTTIKIYKNNLSPNTFTKSLNTPGSFGIEIGSSLWDSDDAAGRFGFAGFYSTVLTDADVIQNFDALKGRYGL
jgi:hypothetical protein